jgi:hypothetical protein
MASKSMTFEFKPIVGKQLPNGDYVLTAQDMANLTALLRNIYTKINGNISGEDILNYSIPSTKLI